MMKLKLFLIFLPTFVRTPAQVPPYATKDFPSIRLVIKIGYKLSAKCKDSVIFSSTNHCVPRASYYVLFQYLGVPKYSHVPVMCHINVHTMADNKCTVHIKISTHCVIGESYYVLPQYLGVPT